MYLFRIIFAFVFQLLATHTFAIPTIPIVGEYLTLSNLCNEGGEDTVSPRIQTPSFNPVGAILQLTFSLCNNQTVRRSSLYQRRTDNIQIRRMLPLLHRRISSPTSRILQTLILRRQIVYTLPYSFPFFLRQREITGFQKLIFLGAMK